MLKTGGSYYYMCPCCTGLRIWTGDGNDFCMNECTCWQYGGIKSAMIQKYNIKHLPRTMVNRAAGVASPLRMMHATPLVCMVCRSKNICVRGNIVLPDTVRKVMRKISLCSRHTPPDHVLGTITSFEDMCKVLGAGGG